MPLDYLEHDLEAAPEPENSPYTPIFPQCETCPAFDENPACPTPSPIAPGEHICINFT